MGFAIMLQTVFALIVVAVAAFFGKSAMFSALAGSIAALVPNVVFALYLKFMVRPSMVRFFIGEAAKVAAMIAISAWVWQSYGSSVNVLAYGVALIVVIKAHNLGLLRATK